MYRSIYLYKDDKQQTPHTTLSSRLANQDLLEFVLVGQDLGHDRGLAHCARHALPQRGLRGGALHTILLIIVAINSIVIIISLSIYIYMFVYICICIY